MDSYIDHCFFTHSHIIWSSVVWYREFDLSCGRCFHMCRYVRICALSILYEKQPKTEQVADTKKSLFLSNLYQPRHLILLHSDVSHFILNINIVCCWVFLWFLFMVFATKLQVGWKNVQKCTYLFIFDTCFSLRNYYFIGFFLE